MSQRIIIAFVLSIILTAVISSPVPGWHKHEHHIVHVPYHIHHLHHYHKYPVYIKSKPIIIKDHGHHEHSDEYSSFSDPWEWDK